MATFTGEDGTVLGPLTTPWVAPTSCTAHLLVCSTCDEGFRGQTCIIESDGTARAQDHTGCWPPVTARAAPVHPFIGWGFYSPGIECPTGYTAACTARHGLNPEWDIQFLLQQGETAIGCCPSGFQCTNRNGNTCIQIASTRPDETVVVQTGVCSEAEVVNVQRAQFPDDITVTIARSDDEDATAETKTTRRQMTLLAPMIQINYRSSDLLPTETSDSSIETSGTTSAPNDGGTGRIEDQETDSGLSSQAIGGIAGGIIGGLLICATVGWIFWRRRRRGRTSRPLISEDVVQRKDYPDIAHTTPPVELGVGYADNELVELPAQYER